MLGAALVTVALAMLSVVGFVAASGTGLHVDTTKAPPTYTCSIAPTLTTGAGKLNLLTGFQVYPGDHDAKVLAITWTAVNDEDSGFAGYWGMDTYVSTFSAWLIGAGPDAGNYYFTQTFSGSFQVPQGAVSPNSSSLLTVEPASGYGTMNGAIIGNLTGYPTFNAGAGPDSGNLGDINYQGTVADLELGTYGNGQTGDASAYNPLSTYFSGGTIAYNWGFDYLLNSAFHTNSHGGSASVNQWCNWDTGAAGDLVTAA